MLDFSITTLADRRGFVGLSLAALMVSAQPGLARMRGPLVLFVCQFGSVKSAVARELFRRRAAARAVPATAFSRGITPEAHISDSLRAALVIEGVNIENEPIRQLHPKDLANADLTVLFDPLPCGLKARRVHDWTDTGSLNQAYQTERPRLLARIEALLDELSGGQLPGATPVRL